MHGLIRQRTKFRTQGGNHPAGQVQIFLIGVAEVFFDRDQFLLTDETVPATQGLGVLGAVGVVFGHVLAHDGCGVFGDVQTGFETVLDAHTRGRFRVNPIPGLACS